MDNLLSDVYDYDDNDDDDENSAVKAQVCARARVRER